jgi:hypothetical protein
VTRIPQLEQELVAAAGRLGSPRRLIQPAARVALALGAFAVAAVLAVIVVADNDKQGGRRQHPASGTPGVPNPDMIDHEAGVRFALNGRVLTVSLLPTATSKTRERVNGARIRATCGRAFAEGPGPGPGPDPRQTRTRLWPAGSTVVRFRFPQDNSRIATWCRLEDPALGHIAFVKFRRGKTLTQEERIEDTGNRWARLFAAGKEGCRFAAQPFCERISCDRISGPIENCTRPSLEYRKSFRDATVEDVAIKDTRAAAKFSNGEVIELQHIGAYATGGVWWIVRLGGNAGRRFFGK